MKVNTFRTRSVTCTSLHQRGFEDIYTAYAVTLPTDVLSKLCSSLYKHLTMSPSMRSACSKITTWNETQAPYALNYRY